MAAAGVMEHRRRVARRIADGVMLLIIRLDEEHDSYG